MSPGFTPRPSLSVPRARLLGGNSYGVAGVHAPAFVERGQTGKQRSSPVVSPGFTPRPSLSVIDQQERQHGNRSVAGVHAPAFVERV